MRPPSTAQRERARIESKRSSEQPSRETRHGFTPSSQRAAADCVLPPICILAGGLGTRLRARVRDTPKPLLRVAGEPFLVHQLRLLADHGAREVVLCVGYLGELIEQQIGCERFGIEIRYSYDSAQLDGTLGAIRGALPLLSERFLVLNGDTYLPLDYAAAVEAWRVSGLPALMVVLHNEGRYEASNAEYAGGRVLRYDKGTRATAMEWVDCGLGGFARDLLERRGQLERDLSELLSQLAADGLLCGFEASTRYYEIGTPATLAETDDFLRSRLRADAGTGAR